MGLCGNERTKDDVHKPGSLQKYITQIYVSFLSKMNRRSMSQGHMKKKQKRKNHNSCIRAGSVRFGESLQTPELAGTCWLFEPFPIKTVDIPFFPTFLFF